jgi:eukaryotic-like serine/threonine-protein kinase
MILLINRTLDHRYTLLELVGGGGMAEVYRAHDELLDRFVAVKILRSQFTTNEEFVTRFRREAQAAAKLSHPNIVNVYDVGVDEEIYYIVMEYISGETLKDKIDRDGILSVENAVHIADEIAQALEHAHQNHLVHCDIKPHNIMVTTTGRIKVTDFGIARAVTSATMVHTGTIIGSVHYFSPEQAKGAPVSAQSDIYSLGVVLYEMLTGKVPFEGDSPISIAIKHIQEEPVPPCQINSEIPPLVEAIVLKAMAKQPEDRFANISEMINDLHLAQGYLRDDSTRRISREEYPTQLLTGMNEALRDSGQDRATTLQPNALDLANKRRKKAWAIAIVFFLLLGFAGGAFLAFGKFWSGAEVTVPDVTGKSVEQAKNILTSHNLRVSVSEVFNDKVATGQVISQTPEAGSVVKEQRTINLIVSRGGEVTSVPDLRGLSRRDAEIALKNAGLVLGKVDEQSSSDAPPDSVLSQYPRPPAQVSKGTAVDIVVNKAAAKKQTLPDFRGTALSAASAQLDGLKLKVGNVTEVASDKYPPGTIIDQRPAPNSEVVEGGVVDFTVAKAGSTAKRATVSITVPDGPVRQAVQIVVSDSSGRRVVYENVHKPGDKIEKQVEGSGSVRVQIYINGGLLQEQTL